MVLSYHNIAEDKGFYTLSLRQFTEQVLYLKENYKVVSVDTYVNHVLEHGKCDPHAVAITFDDAYVSYATMAVPLLQELGLPSTVFVCTGFLGKSNEWNEIEYRCPIMPDETVVELSTNPLVTIGAHTVTHPALATLQRPQAYYELNESKLYLEQLLGRKINYIAYPYGQLHTHVNQRIYDLVKELGYKAAFTTNHDITNTRNIRFRMNRIDVAAEDDLEQFKLRLLPNNPFFLAQKKQNRSQLIYRLRPL